MSNALLRITHFAKRTSPFSSVGVFCACFSAFVTIDLSIRDLSLFSFQLSHLDVCSLMPFHQTLKHWRPLALLLFILINVPVLYLGCG